MNFPLDDSQYEILHQIGVGRFSTVYAARCLTNNQLVAIKQIDLDIIPFDSDQLRRGFAQWSSAKHPRLVQYYGSFVTGHYLRIITEYLNGGSLLDALKYGYPNGFGDEALIATILRMVLEFLAFFHDANHIHRVLHTGNIMVTMDGELKVSDLFLSADLIRQGQLNAATVSSVGSWVYVAPEAIECQDGYNQKADIWSLGIIAYTIATGSSPFPGPPAVQINNILRGQMPSIAGKGYSSKFENFLACCLQRQPEKRKTARELLKHNFLKAAKDATYIQSRLISRLPPLCQRFKVLGKNSAKTGEESQQQQQPARISFDFGEAPSQPEEDAAEKVQAPVVVKKGRFQITTWETPPQTTQ